MRVVTPVEMREIDNYAINVLKIPGVILMENAGRSVAKTALEIIKNASHREVAIFCGKGNNGGDGFVTARYLMNWGFSVTIYLCCSEEDLKGDSLVHYRILKEMACPVIIIDGMTQLDSFYLELSSKYSLIIDGLLGTGLIGSPKGMVLGLIREINKSSVPVLAIDIPSGVNGETGKIEGEGIFASWTVTFGYIKRGLLQDPGEKYAGEVTVEDIAIPPWVSDELEITDEITTESIVKRTIPPIFKDDHKGNRGKVLVVGGSPGMTGAPLLSAMASARSGAGLVTVGMGESLASIGESHSLEVMTLRLPDNRGILKADALDAILEYLDRGINCIAIGPGLSPNRWLIELVGGVIKNSLCPVVIDADGLNVLAGNLEVLLEAKSSIVLTPHLGEFARLLGTDINTIQQDRLNLVKEFAKKYSVTLLLKGHRTIIASHTGKVYWNLTGNPALATAGSGDVLTGIITSLIAQGADPFMATVASAYIHGMAGDSLATEIGTRGIIASDIIDILPYILKKITG